MKSYDCYRLSMRLRSPWGTPWQADTLMGHLAWMVAYREGDKGIRKFLHPFVAGEPPFALSDGFPAGLLPRPIGQEKSRVVEDLSSYTEEKARRKSEFLTPDQFEAVRRGEDIEVEPSATPWTEIETLHAGISRTTGTTTGEAGNLFQTESWTIRQEFWPNDLPAIEIYLWCLSGWAEKVEKLFVDLALVGFGRDKSAGLGQFELSEMEPWNGFSNFSGANGFIALSTYVPSPDDPTDGRWALNVKYGKLGENAGSGNPFKRPLLQIKPGAVFRTGGKPKPFYGRSVKGLAPGFPDAVQICYCLAVPSRL